MGNDVGVGDDMDNRILGLSSADLTVRLIDVSLILTLLRIVPGEDEGISNEEAPLEAINRMDIIINSLINKISLIRLGPCKRGRKMVK